MPAPRTRLLWKSVFTWAVIVQLIESSVFVLYIWIVGIPKVLGGGDPGLSGGSALAPAAFVAAFVTLFAVPAARVLLRGYSPARLIGLATVQVIYILACFPPILGALTWFIPLGVLNVACLFVLVAFRPLATSTDGRGCD